MMRAAGTIALCGALLAGASSPAVAARDPKVQLKIVNSVKGGATKTAWLHCAPTGGSHPDARTACRQLRQVGGDPAKLNVSPNTACTKEFQPRVIGVVGRWHGKTVKWGKVFANGCQAKAATGAVAAL
ncbi:SSI family serine proteinase inhibitor [Nonomuraea diastatica]|uniref:Subtilisin inhibitor domain-containing protein n=1 Tax=Nonomuraea diastatica TaxID=1848329 RepID=A0A4V2YDQ7_9ACTN|nr:SSI family serine proteinase inhibitor [Nonomuraea diastatica]TDD16296.1 hypothetical protein E1294_31815 [Nonomuraea diastatica]